MNLEQLSPSLPEHEVFGSPSIEVSRINIDSRKATQVGDLFIAIKGLTHDSHKHIAKAVQDGARVIVGERDPSEFGLNGATYIKVNNGREALGLLASAWFRHPSQKLEIVGVTGTEGKTTTSSIIHHILEKSGNRTGLVSTINAKIGDKTYDTGLHVTNPEALPLQELLSKMVEEGCKNAVLETTSIGIDQYRVAGVKYDIGVLTNITHDHIDYHKTVDAYREAKAKLFRQVKTAILNRDDSSFEFMRLQLALGAKLVTYSILGNADFKAANIEVYDGQSNFEVTAKGHKAEITTNLIGKYNVANTLAAITTARELNVSWEAIQEALKTFQTPEGRLENVNKNSDIPIFVDFAHTPNSIRNVLAAIRDISLHGRVIAVYGSAGERDSIKRPEMGKIGTQLADIVIFTADDPRSEKVSAIISEMEKGAIKSGAQRVDPNNLLELNSGNGHVYTRVEERGEAIALAVKIAKPGDKVAILGKGHEKSMPYNGVEYPWSDQEAAKIALSGGVKTIQRPLKLI